MGLVFIYSHKIMFYFAEKGNLTGIKIMEKLDNDLKDIRDNENYTLFHYAAVGNNVLLLDYLYEKKVPIDTQVYDGTTPLMLASMNKNIDILKWFIAKSII